MNDVMSHNHATWPVVHVVGISGGGAASLGPRERGLVDAADLLCGGARHLAFFPDHTAERFTVRSNLDELLALLRTAVGSRRAVVLASSDPCYFGVGPLLAEGLGRERVIIHPNVSSVALCFARLGVAWHDAVVLSAHGRPVESVVAPALAAAKFAVLTDPQNTPARVAAALRTGGMEDASAWVCEHLGGANERIVASTLYGLAGMEFAALNILAVVRDTEMQRDGGLCDAPAWANAFGRPESAYASERGQVTKAEVRAIALSKLEPWRAGVGWDLGAGSGSLAIELAGLMPRGTLYAVESDAAQIAVLHRNLQTYPAENLRVVEGRAPEATAGLPPPDAVFVGGAGTALTAVLEHAAAVLLPGGRLVANFAQLESLATWQAVARGLGWPAEILQVAIARGAAIGEGTRLAPLNPVFVTVLRRPTEPRS